MSETEKNESQVQPMKENSAKKNDLKFKIEWPDEDLKTNINEKRKLMKFSRIILIIIQKVKKKVEAKKRKKDRINLKMQKI